ncbi:MAG TPA: response regulator [Pyrinomonadaceae bacterium]|nr:response regulator [Pyrinomonadaceae bacterium]
MSTRPLITVVDDDESVRESLPDLLKEFGFEAQTFSSAEEFLASDLVDETKCLVLDVVMPGMSGPDLQQELARRDQEVPIVFITGQRDPATRLRLVALGAVDCLFKPFEANDLLKALNTALQAS